MALANYEAEQRLLGNLIAAEEARRLREAHGDLAAVEVTEHGVVMPNEDTRARIESFRPKTRIYALSGERFMRFPSFTHRTHTIAWPLSEKADFEKLQEERSRRSWVAFTPYPLVELDPIGKSPEELQAEIDAGLAEYNRELQDHYGNIDDVEAVQGTLSDYLDLGYSYLERDGAFLGELNWLHTGNILTSTQMDGSPAIVQFGLETWVRTMDDLEKMSRHLEEITAGSRDFPNGFKNTYILQPLIVPRAAVLQEQPELVSSAV